MNNSLQHLKLVSWIIWAALLMAVVVYLAVLGSGAVDSTGSEGETESMRSILLTVAMIQFVMSFGVRFYVTRRSFAAAAAKGAGEGLAGVPPIIGFGSYIVSLALAEGCAIYGLILGFLGAEGSEYGIFFALGFVGILFQPPTFIAAPGKASGR